jgi:dihydroorotase
VNTQTVTLVREPVTVPASYDCNGTTIVPFHAGETLNWRFAG